MNASIISIFLFFNVLCLNIAHGAFVTPSFQQNIVYDVFNERGMIHSKWNHLISSASYSTGNEGFQRDIQLKMSTQISSSNNSLEEKELTPDTVVEMIEVSFINACLQLAKGYVDVLKLFIVSVKAAYGMGITVPDLVAKLEVFPFQTANRPLMAEEVLLRSTWINLIYMMLENLEETDKFIVENSTVDNTIRQKYEEYIQFVTDWRKAQNYEDRDAAAMVTELNVDDVLKDCSRTDASSMTDPMEKAMLPQNLRVALLTLVVIEEEKRCFEDDGGNLDPMPPQPPIPGTK